MTDRALVATGARRRAMRVRRAVELSSVRRTAPFVPQQLYMRALVGALRRWGMHIEDTPIYISPTAWFDGADYGLVSIGRDAVISSHVDVLTHDYSISRARDLIQQRRVTPEVAVVRPVSIGRNSFIGRRVLLLPGAVVGDSCIVGAGSVVRGVLPPATICVGNPAVEVGDASTWGHRQLGDLDAQ